MTITEIPDFAKPENLPPYPKAEPIRLELGAIAFLPVDLHFVLGAIQERSDQAADAGVWYGLNDFVRDALIEYAHR